MILATLGFFVSSFPTIPLDSELSLRFSLFKVQRHGFLFPFVLALCCCDKIPEINNLEAEMYILAHGFRDFHPWWLGPVAVGLLRQCIMAGAYDRGGTHLIAASMNRGRGQGLNAPYKIMLPRTGLFFTRPHLLKVPLLPDNGTGWG